MKNCIVCGLPVDKREPYRINPTGEKTIRIDDPNKKGELIDHKEPVYDHTDPKAELIHLNCKLPTDK